MAEKVFFIAVRRTILVSMEDLSDEERRWLADAFEGVAHPYRIAVLRGLAADESLPAVAERVGTTRGTLQHHVEKLIAADLVYRDGSGEFVVSPLGRYVARVVMEASPDIVAAQSLVEDAEEDVEEELAPARDVLDEAEWERKVHTRTWEVVKDEMEELLET